MSGAESLSDDWIGKGEDSTADRNTKKIYFPGLPKFLYQKKILEEIGSLAEGVIKLDIKIDNRKMGQFTRMADFVNLENLFTFQVLVNGQLQYRSGHGGEEISKSSLSSEIAPAKKRDALPTMGEAFGPWIVVERKSRSK
ncbi:hypothetical protein Goklo_021178 [Gossypium klotzschianum]|uniref:DUF4283 domain-containing protein n=1 Tax=Gossypium klotzschianum TaxID=34286 RepID=A0A7J8UUJ1_9ROSI|nr:hypothetical protein [Gossypium klotzschianum]